jgi:ornithine cyclodeaminase/alanine dehydrogenase-like protein (mu-crystallin family)
MQRVTVVLHDEDVRAHLEAGTAVRWMAEAVDAHHRGDLLAPPRAHTDLDGGRLVFTAGRLRGSWFGYRSYDSFPTETESGEHVVVVHDERTGDVRALAIGKELGRRRVGAIGAVAADSLAAPDAAVVAVVGAGYQAFTQLWGLAAVRRLDEVRVHSRDPTRRASFARAAEEAFGVACRPAPGAREALSGAQIVVLATDSPAPVVQASWLEPDAYVTTLGPKQRGNAEFGLDLPEAAAELVTDSLAQVDSYDPPNLLVGTAHRDRLVSLGAVRARKAATSGHGEGIAVFFSVGLAGTEAFLLDRLASSMSSAAERNRTEQPGHHARTVDRQGSSGR